MSQDFKTYQEYCEKQQDLINGLRLLKDKFLSEKKQADEIKGEKEAIITLKEFYTLKLKSIEGQIEFLNNGLKNKPFERWKLENFKSPTAGLSSFYCDDFYEYFENELTKSLCFSYNETVKYTAAAYKRKDAPGDPFRFILMVGSKSAVSGKHFKPFFHISALTEQEFIVKIEKFKLNLEKDF